MTVKLNHTIVHARDKRACRAPMRPAQCSNTLVVAVIL
jgi:hypothetical protein